MKAIDRPFTKIVNGTSQFVIPVFQRDYSWTEANCDQLWKDVLRIAKEPTDRGHCLGSVVYVSTGDSAAGFTRWLLIDGQQRLTTLTLMLTALRDYLADTGWKGSADGPTAKRIEAYFLKNVQEEGDRQNKLVLRRHDQSSLRALLDRKDLPEGGSERIRENYEFFLERIEAADPEDIYRGIGRLVVVDVTLDRGTDDPQLIFESLNSTGLDLSQSDLIRNFILMRLQEKEQTRLYETYWSKIENLFRGSERTFDTFIRDYIALRTQASKQEKAGDIYFAFRREFGSIGSEPKKLDGLLQELLRLARYHAAFSIGADGPTTIKEPLARLRRLVDVPGTLVIKLFDCHEADKTLNLEQFAQALGLIESYIFRRAICGEQTRGYWQVFANLAYRIDPKNPLESLKVGLACLPDSYGFPSDEEFRKALEDRDMYHKRVCFDLLDRLENHGSKEPTDTSRYSIEHIMPQNEKLSRDWKQMLGNKWQDAQREWLHRLGNLTLTGYNSTYSDRSFEQKKTIPGGFKDSSVRLNKFVREQRAWVPRKIEQRGKELASRALLIWPGLVVDQMLILKAKEAEVRERAQRRDVSKVPMSPAARQLFEVLREKIKAFDAGIIELAEQKSVSYHERAFFLEVIPRKSQIGLLLPLDFNEIEDPSGLFEDTSQWKFIVNAAHEGGAYVNIRREGDIDKVLPVIRQAREIAGS
jgi:predicted transport protein